MQRDEEHPEIAERERGVLDGFRDYYGAATSPAIRELELRALGTEFGGNSYTDIDQARHLIRLLDLRPGVDLLEVGAGSGWPGLFLARESGCRAVLSDVPVEGLRVARTRAHEEGIANSEFVAASGTGLPFKDGSFDAVGHSDVLC